MVIWWNKAPEIESVLVFRGKEMNAIVRVDKYVWDVKSCTSALTKARVQKFGRNVWIL